MEESQQPPSKSVESQKETTSFSFSDIPDIKNLLEPTPNDNALVNEQKIRRLYLQSSMQQWFAPKRINFEQPIELDPEARRIWIRLMHVFYTLEKMGLTVIGNMVPKAIHKMKSEEAAYYLSAQTFDEWALPDGTRPHGLVADEKGTVWMTGNGNGTLLEIPFKQSSGFREAVDMRGRLPMITVARHVVCEQAVYSEQHDIGSIV